MQSLEAILFLAHEPLNARKLSQFAGLADGTAALTLIRRLNAFYAAEGRAFRVEQVSGGYQLMTHPALADWLRRLAIAPAEVKLSTPAMETLAVVAYRQPVQRADIEAIRGVACGEMLRQLMERDLVRIEGRSEVLGRPFLYGTTNRFLHVFGLGSIDDLPRADSLRLALSAGGPAAVNGHQDHSEGAAAASTALAMKESTVTATIDDVMELDPTVAGLPGDFDNEAGIAVADLDDDEFDDDEDDDDDLDDDDEDDADDDFDDDFDDEFEDDDDWDDDEDDEDDLVEDDEEDDDEWEEVEDDDDDEDDEEDWEEDDED